MLGPLWKLTCRKSAHRCGAKHIPKSKCIKHLSVGPLLEVDLLKKCTPLWREAHFEVKMRKALQCRTTFGSWDVEKALKSARRCGAKHMSKSHMQKIEGHGGFWTFRCRFAWQAQGIVHLVKRAQNVRVTFVAFQKQWQVGTFEEDLQRCFLMAGAVQETHGLDMLGGQGANFLREVAFWSIGSSGLLRWFCVTGGAHRMTWLHFSWQAQYFRQMEWNNRKTHLYEAVSSALNFPFLKEVSQNCFVFDVVNFEHWTGLAE